MGGLIIFSKLDGTRAGVLNVVHPVHPQFPLAVLSPNSITPTSPKLPRSRRNGIWALPTVNSSSISD